MDQRKNNDIYEPTNWEKIKEICRNVGESTKNLCKGVGEAAFVVGKNAYRTTLLLHGIPTIVRQVRDFEKYKRTHTTYENTKMTLDDLAECFGQSFGAAATYLTHWIIMDDLYSSSITVAATNLASLVYEIGRKALNNAGERLKERRNLEATLDKS